MAQCICGRELTQDPHCPKCGRKFLYSTPSRNYNATAIDGQEYTIRAFHCRSCGSNFDDTTTCIAPPPKIAKQKPTEKRYITELNLARAQQEANNAIVNLAADRIRSGKWKMTQEREDTYLTKFGISLSQLTDHPIVGIDPFDPNDEPTVHTAEIDDPN